MRGYMMAAQAVSDSDLTVVITLSSSVGAKVKFAGCEDIVDVLTLLQKNDWVSAHDMTEVRYAQQTPPRVFINTSQIISFAPADEQ